MQKQLLFLGSVGAGTVGTGLDAGDIDILDADGNAIFTFNASALCGCDFTFRRAGTPQQVEVTCVAPTDDAACCGDDRRWGIKVQVQRSPNFDHETYLDSYTTDVYDYPFQDGVAVTANDLASWLVDQINLVDAFTAPKAYTAALKGGDPTTVVITTLSGDYPVRVSNIRDYVANTITETVAAVPTRLSDAEVKRKFPLGIGFIPGQDAPTQWQGCKTPAYVEICGCLPAGCSGAATAGHNSNAVHLHMPGATPFTLQIWFDDTDHAGSVAFAQALETAAGTTCPDIDTGVTPV